MHSCLKLSLVLSLLYLPVFDQDEKATLDATVRHEDAVFWKAYNRCDVGRMSQFFWPDFELAVLSSGQRLPTSAAAAAGGHLMAVETTLRLESTKRFPLFHRDDDGC